MQTCITCHVEQPLSAYHKSKDTASGHRRKCRKCVSAYMKTRGVMDTEQRAGLNAKVRARLEKNISYRLHMYAKKRARQHDIPFDIDITDVVVPLTCPITLEVMIFNRGTFQRNSASLDRVDPTKGYVKGNIQVISWAANKAKAELTPDMIHRLSEYIKKGSL